MKRFFLFLWFFFLLFSSITRAQIRITEVFFDGTDEWIELLNDGTDTFSGTLIISGAKNSAIEIGDFVLMSDQVALIGDAMKVLDDWILSESVLVYSGQGLSIADTKQIDLSVMFDETILDQVLIDAADVQRVNNTNASFHLSLQGGLYTGRTSCKFVDDDESEPYEGICANPGKVLGDKEETAMTGLDNQEISVVVDNPELSGDISSLSGQSGQVLDTSIVNSLENGIEYTIEELTGVQLTGVYLSNSLENEESVEEDECVCKQEESDLMQDEKSLPDISIRSIHAAPTTGSESIGLRLDRGPDLMDLEGYYLMRGSTRRYLHGNLLKGELIEIYQNFGFPNTQGACIVLHDPEGGIMDDICYTESQVSGLSKRISLEEGIDESVDVVESVVEDVVEDLMIAPPTLDVEIVDVLFDPEGSDTHNESITIQNNNSYEFQENELRIQVGERKSKTYIKETVEGEGNSIINGNHRFPNTSTCLMLMRQESVQDVYCYVVQKEILASECDYLPEQKKEKIVVQESLQEPVQEKEREKILSEEKVFIAQAGMIEILSIDYNPDGLDYNNESIELLYVASGSISIDLQHFYLMVNGKKRSIEGLLESNQAKTLVGNHRFPNTGACVALYHQDVEVSSYCYGEEGEETEDDLLGSVIEKKIREKKDLTEDEHAKGISLLPSLVIQSILPNPTGKDQGNEYIIIQGEVKEHLDGLKVLVKGKKYALSSLEEIKNEEDDNTYKYRGTLNLPNRTGCVDLELDGSQLDRFCYHGDSEEIRQEHQEWLEKMSTEELQMVNAITLKQDKEKECVSYRGVQITCKPLKTIKQKVQSTKSQTKSNKTSTSTSAVSNPTKLDKFYRSYIQTMHDYLYGQRPNVYHRTDMKQYMQLYRSIDKEIRDGKAYVKIGSREYRANDFSAIIADQQTNSYYERVVGGLDVLFSG